MANGFSRTAVFGLMFGLLVAGCREKPEEGVVHREISEMDSDEALKKAFIDPVEDAEKKPDRGIDQFFTEMGEATRSGGGIETGRFFTTEGMLAAVGSSGSLDHFSKSQRKAFETGFRKGTGNLGEALRQMAFDRHRIQLVEEIDEDEKLVYVRLYDNELGVVQPMRWWLLKTGDGWRIYDFEDLSSGIRTVSLMSTLLENGIGGKPAPWIKDFVPVAELSNKLDISDPERIEEFREPLEKLRAHELPEDIGRFASIMMTTVHLTAGDSERALAELREAEVDGYGSPLHDYLVGTCLASLGENKEALKHYENHIEKFGRDSDVLEMMADSRLALGERAAARAAAGEGLEDNPLSEGCLMTWVAASEPEEIAGEEVKKRFGKMSDPALTYEFTLDYLIQDGFVPQARSLFTNHAKEILEPDLNEYYEEELAKE